MRAKWGYCLFIFAALMLGGCFQNASGNLQPSSSTALPNDDAPTSQAPFSGPDVITNTPFGQSADDGLQAEGSPTFPPLTVSHATFTPAVVNTTLPDDQPGADAEANPGQVFITPGSPMIPSDALDTPTPEGLALSEGDNVPADQAEIPATPSGLITPTAFALNDPSQSCVYIIQPGDTLGRIATRAGSTVNEIMSMNSITNPNRISPGQEIFLPCDENETQATAPDPTEDESAVSAPPVSGQSYTVQRGDSLFTIAQRFGTTVADLTAANNLTNPNNLQVGQTLIIPD